MKRNIILLYLVFTSLLANGQKAGLSILPLQYNAAQHDQFLHSQGIMRKASLDTMQLPFFDDFSYADKWMMDTAFHNINPFDTLWMDHKVFINCTFTDSAPSLGVATFDGLNEMGQPYDPYAIRSSSLPCDTLTSRPIDLSGINAKDTTLIFSFYSQPWGLGVAPKEADTLVLEFKFPKTNTLGHPVLDTNKNQVYQWKHVWASTGILKGVSSVPAFTLSMIQVHDTFFYKGFQFRFINYANRSGNLDHWNIDYVWLDRQRVKDSMVNDIALQKQPTPLLAKYYLVPARHLLNATTGLINYVAANNFGPVRNNGTDSNSVNTYFWSTIQSIFNTNGVTGKYPFAYTPQLVWNIEPLTTWEFKDDSVKIRGAKNVSLINNLNLDTLSFLTTHTLSPAKSGNTFTQNDKSMRMQTLTNVYAYDDGSAEAGIGLINVQSAQMAVEFTTIKDDVLQGILVHFNQSEVDVSSYPFTLTVWQSIDLINPPGKTHDNVVWKLENTHATYVNWRDGYIYYQPDTPLALTSPFYIGWQQSTAFVLNVGLDRNYDEISNHTANSHIYYNVDGSWKQNTEIHGAPMIRAVIGNRPFAGIEKENSGTANISLYPNPSNGKFTLRLPENTKCTAMLYSMNGELLSTEQKLSGEAQLDYSHLPAGMYLMKVSSNSQVWYQKLMIR